MRFKRRVNMLEGSLLPNILLFAIPLMISGILQLLFNAIDMIVVGKFSGSTSMAAVSSTSSLINLVTNLFIGLSVGTSVSIARRIGEGKREEVSKAVQTSVLISLVTGGILAVFGVISARYLLQRMKSPEDVIDLSTLYLRVYFTGMPATMVYNFGSAILRAKGDTRRPLQALSVAGVLNALLNLVFVLVVKMDVAGVGLASSLSSYVSAFLVIDCLVHETSEVKLDIHHLYIDKAALWEIVRIGLPAGVQGTLFSLSNVVIQSSINSYGKIVMAGNGAATSIEGFVYNAMAAFNQTCLTFTSQNMGAGKLKRVVPISIYSQLCVIVTGILLGGGAYLFGNLLLKIYASDPEVIAAGMIRLSYVSKNYFLCGIMDVFVGSLRGIGSSMVPMMVSLIGVCAFRLVWIATVYQSSPTIETLYLSYPISWIITAMVHMICFMILYLVRQKEQQKLSAAAQ